MYTTDKIESLFRFLLITVMLITLIGSMIPYGVPLTFPILFILFLGCTLKYKSISIPFNKFYVIYYFLIIVYLLSILSSNQFVVYDRNIRDIQNIITSLLFLFVLSVIDRKELKFIMEKLLISIPILMFIISILSLLKFVLLLNGMKLKILVKQTLIYPWGTSLITDYNMFSYSLSIGIISMLILYRKANEKKNKYFLIITILLSTTTILFSGSRRGWIVLFFLLFFIILKVFKKIKLTLNRKKILIICLGLLFLSSSFIVLNKIDIKNEEVEKLKYRFSTIQNGGFSQRTDRWDYALKIYQNEFTIKEKIFGGGFDYLPLFASKFAPHVKEDYPHSPILSSLLYGGLIGFIISIIFIINLINSLIKIKNEYKYDFLLIFVISLMYVLISGNSWFSNKLFLFLIIIILLFLDNNTERAQNIKVGKYKKYNV